MKPAFIGVDLGGTKLRVACGDTEGKIIFNTTVPTKPHLESEHLQNRIINTIEGCIKNIDSNDYDIKSIGIGIPGVYFKKRIYLCDNIDNLEIADIVDYFKREYNISAFILNDVKSAALGESWQGVSKGVENVVYVNIGTGISLGLILNGKLYSGRNNASGEIAYLITDTENPRGFKDGYAPLENIFSGKAISGKVRELLKTKSSPFFEEVNGDFEKIDARMVFGGYKQGDELCRLVVEEGSKYLGTALANIAITLNPDMMVFGGGVSQDFDVIKALIQDTINHMVPFPPEIVKAALGKEAGVIGAIRIAMLGPENKI